MPNGIKKSIFNFKNRKLKNITKGKYYPPLYNGITIKDSKKFENTYLYNAIMAQKIYNGVIINNTRYVDAFKKNNLNKIDSIL